MALANRGLSPIYFITNALVWISAVIVMGILAYWFSESTNQPESITYMLVVSVLTVALFLVAFCIGALLSYLHIFNLIFSYLWLVVFAFAAALFTHSGSRLAHTVEAFSFLAFFFLFVNVLYSWHVISSTRDDYAPRRWGNRSTV